MIQTTKEVDGKIYHATTQIVFVFDPETERRILHQFWVAHGEDGTVGRWLEVPMIMKPGKENE